MVIYCGFIIAFSQNDIFCTCAVYFLRNKKKNEKQQQQGYRFILFFETTIKVSYYLLS